MEKRARGGSFKTLGLDMQVLQNIPFENPTPIQRKTMPLILERRSIMGIGRTGSGKTLCYLIPAIVAAMRGDDVVVFVPTKELVVQVKTVYKMLSHRVVMKGKVQITTLRDIDVRNAKMIVVDEIDRVLEERSLREHYEKIMDTNTGCQKVFFSATLPEQPIDIMTVAIENKIPDTIKHSFFYVPAESKESALLTVMDREKKTIVFAATRYGVEFVLEVLGRFGYKARGIYSSMDDDARKENFREFVSGKTKILVVTDVAARGLDIPHLDVSISYDLSDEKTFVHRVGRIRGMGEQYSFVTYSDVFHFFNIRETHLPEIEIGTIPQHLLDSYDMSGLEHMRFSATRGYQRCLDFRRKVRVPAEFKTLVDRFEVHSRFRTKETLADQIKKMRARTSTEPSAEPSAFRDQFYIPYARSEGRTHCSAFSVMHDDYRRHS